MRLCVATCWEDQFLRELATLARPDGRVHEVFGSLSHSATGSGRDAALVPDVRAEAVRRHVEVAHSVGIRFNYLMNGSCMGGAEYTRAGREELLRQIRWVEEIGADAVTITVPVLAELVRNLAPHLEVVVSTIAHVDSVSAARTYREMGARRLVVSTTVNRDLPLLRVLAEHSGCEIEVLANELCLYRCPMRGYHYDLMAHGSGLATPLPSPEYPHLHCSARRMRDPGELLKARFVRPEDVAIYERQGIHLFKIAGRGLDAQRLLLAAAAYLNRRHDGNLVEITDLGLWSGEGAPPPRIAIDNRALDGFLEKVASVDCEHACGTTCMVCDRLAERIVTIEQSQGYLTALDRARRALTEGGADGSPGPTDH